MTLRQNIFTETYLFSQNHRAEIKRTFFLGLLILVFFLLVRPFGIDVSPGNILMVGSAIILIAIVLKVSLYFLIRRTELHKTWTLGAEVLKTLCYLLLLAICSSCLAGLIGLTTFNTQSVSQFAFYTCAYAVVPISISKLWEHNRRLTEQIQTAQSTQAETRTAVLISPVKADRYEGKASQIRYLQSDGNYVIIHEQSKKHHVRLTLKSAEEQLSGLGFLRVHRSYLINPAYIGKIMSRHLVLKDGTRIPISRQFRTKMVEGKAVNQ